MNDHIIPSADSQPTQWIARCPSHDDRTRSLSVTEIEDGRVLIHCFAGCSGVGWPEYEVIALNAAPIAGKNEDQIRALVQKLEIARKQTA